MSGYCPDCGYVICACPVATYYCAQNTALAPTSTSVPPCLRCADLEAEVARLMDTNGAISLKFCRELDEARADLAAMTAKRDRLFEDSTARIRQLGADLAAANEKLAQHALSLAEARWGIHHNQCHDLVCNGSGKYPRGTPGTACSCRGRDDAYAELAQREQDVEAAFRAGFSRGTGVGPYAENYVDEAWATYKAERRASE